MAEPRIGLNGQVDLTINDVVVDFEAVSKFEWASAINGGYVVEAEINDPNYSYLTNITGQQSEDIMDYLKEGRQRPVPVRWKLFHAGTDFRTEERLAYLVSLYAYGSGQDAKVKFVAQDPPTYLLSAGVADGRVYQGSIGGDQGVIAKCVREFTRLPGEDESRISVKVTPTIDSKEGVWPMFRMDPKTYIRTLLDWSSPLTKDKESRWIISSKDTQINIVKASDLTGENIRIYDVASDVGAEHVKKWNLEMHSHMTVLQGRLVTAGISSTSGAELEVVVDDKSTPKKVTPLPPGEGQDRAFTKPKSGDEWPVDLPATYIRPIPEHTGGEVTKNYEAYIDGRARQIFDDMLTNVMRITIIVDGEYKLDNSELLGVSTCTLNWPGRGGSNYFPYGKWIIDGFHHFLRKRDAYRSWMTRIYLYRIDWDAEAEEVLTREA